MNKPKVTLAREKLPVRHEEKALRGNILKVEPSYMCVEE